MVICYRLSGMLMILNGRNQEENHRTKQLNELDRSWVDFITSNRMSFLRVLDSAIHASW